MAQAWVWEQLRAALRLFTPEGTLNTWARAAAEVRAALDLLEGPEFQADAGAEVERVVNEIRAERQARRPGGRQEREQES